MSTMSTFILVWTDDDNYERVWLCADLEAATENARYVIKNEYAPGLKLFEAVPSDAVDFEKIAAEILEERRAEHAALQALTEKKKAETEKQRIAGIVREYRKLRADGKIPEDV